MKGKWDWDPTSYGIKLSHLDDLVADGAADVPAAEAEELKTWISALVGHLLGAKVSVDSIPKTYGLLEGSAPPGVSKLAVRKPMATDALTAMSLMLVLTQGERDSFVERSEAAILDFGGAVTESFECSAGRLNKHQFLKHSSQADEGKSWFLKIPRKPPAWMLLKYSLKKKARTWSNLNKCLLIRNAFSGKSPKLLGCNTLMLTLRTFMNQRMLKEVKVRLLQSLLAEGHKLAEEAEAIAEAGTSKTMNPTVAHLVAKVPKPTDMVDCSLLILELSIRLILVLPELINWVHMLLSSESVRTYERPFKGRYISKVYAEAGFKENSLFGVMEGFFKLIRVSITTPALYLGERSPYLFFSDDGQKGRKSSLKDPQTWRLATFAKNMWKVLAMEDILQKPRGINLFNCEPVREVVKSLLKDMKLSYNQWSITEFTKWFVRSSRENSSSIKKSTFTTAVNYCWQEHNAGVFNGMRRTMEVSRSFHM
ncbi:hypothetical protein Ancab_017041 [Ancistrocladus abbreviatus]